MIKDSILNELLIVYLYGHVVYSVCVSVHACLYVSISVCVCVWRERNFLLKDIVLSLVCSLAHGLL